MERSNSKSKSLKRPVNRRTFFDLLVGAAASVVGVVSIDSIISRNTALKTSISTSTATPAVTTTVTPPTETRTDWSASTSPFANTNVAQVVVVKGTANTDAQAFVDKALEALGGVEELVPAGANILIKPNVGFYDKDPTTDPRITAAVVKALKKTQPAQDCCWGECTQRRRRRYALQVTGHEV